MLSAVAARKARLEGKVLPSQAASNLSSAPPPPPPARELTKTTKQAQKRKSSEPIAKPPKKKKKPQGKHAEEKHTRYFEEDAFKSQQDVITVANEESDVQYVFQDDMSDDGEVYEHADFAAKVPLTPTASEELSKTAKSRRAWSPSGPLRDSSDEEDGDAVQHDAEDLGIPSLTQTFHTIPSSEAPQLLSSFRPIVGQNTFHLTSGDVAALDESVPQSRQEGTVLVLAADDTLALLGTYSLTVLAGSVSLYGTTLSASWACHRVFAPRSASIPVIKCLLSNGRARESTISLPDWIRNAAVGSAAVILLQELQTGVENLGLVCRTFDGVFAPSRWQSISALADLNLHNIQLVTHHTHDLSPLLIPQAWEDTTEDFIGPAADADRADIDYSRRACIVKGPKNAGKSTLARILLNRLMMRYRRVAFLECDLGQSEFTPGGLVALNILDKPVFGPPFTHPSVPHAAHYVGAVSPRSSPSYYLESIKALIHTYNLDIQHAALLEEHNTEPSDGRISDFIPLVVNTMGWTKGLGAYLSGKIEELVEPSHIFEIQVPMPDDVWGILDTRDRFQDHDSASHGVKHYCLTSIISPTLPNHFTATDHRSLSILSYFYAVFPSDPPMSPIHTLMATNWDTALPLCAQRPYEVDCRVAFDNIVLVGAGMEDVVPSELRHVLNGAIVALVRCDAGTFDTDSSTSADILRYQQGAAPPSPVTSTCIGLALVRSLSSSPSSPSLRLLTPIPPHLLQSARIVIKGELELPVWGMLDFQTTDSGGVAGVERGKVPYLKWGKSEGAGGERRRVRRNLMRKGQM